MKFVLFPLHDAEGNVDAVGVVVGGDALDPIPLADLTLDDAVRELSKSIRTQYPGALVMFTDQPDAHPDVARVLTEAVARAVDDEQPIHTAASLCDSCTRASVCAVAVAASLLAQANPRIAGCDAHRQKENDDD